MKTAVIGLGNRGVGMLKVVLDGFKDVEVLGVCDVLPERAEAAKKMVEGKRGNTPLVTVNADEILNLPLDCVIITTAWEAHVPLAIKAMKKGIRPGIEVGCAYSLNECFEVLRVYEETGVPVMMLENSLFHKETLILAKLARAGFFGDIAFCSAGYKHYLAEEILYHGYYNHHYRLRNYKTRNCENYPTHELCSIMKMLDIHNGNRMVKLSSFASKSVGLKSYVKKNPERLEVFKDAEFNQGDIITTVITCADGTNIVLTLDTTLPRAYGRDYTIRGTDASYFGENRSFYIDGNKEHEKEAESWVNCHGNANEIFAKESHPIWDKYGKKALETQSMSGHGGVDYIVLGAFFETVEKGVEGEIDTYDTITLMSIAPLSEASILKGGAAVEIPDFTGGRWAMPRPSKDGLEFRV